MNRRDIGLVGLLATVIAAVLIWALGLLLSILHK